MAILATTFPIFKPAMRIISNITNGYPATVTTTFSHGYIDGLVIRFLIPPGYGMMQANQLFGAITVTSSTTFTIAIDTTNFVPFTTPVSAPDNEQYPQSVPIAEINSSLLSATRNVLPY